jgi:hypothetical protein
VGAGQATGDRPKAKVPLVFAPIRGRTGDADFPDDASASLLQQTRETVGRFLARPEGKGVELAQVQQFQLDNSSSLSGRDAERLTRLVFFLFVLILVDRIRSLSLGGKVFLGDLRFQDLFGLLRERCWDHEA